MNAESEAIINDRDKTIAQVYFGKDGGSTPYKTYLDAKAIDPRITLDWVRSWFSKNIENKASRWGKKLICGAAGLPRVPNGFVFHNRPTVPKPGFSNWFIYDRCF